jgi:hypothetical protein
MGDPAPGCGMLLSFLVEVNLLPSLGAVNGADTVDISAFKLRRAHIPITPRLSGCECHVVFLPFCRAELNGWGFSRRRGRLSFSAELVGFHPIAVHD